MDQPKQWGTEVSEELLAHALPWTWLTRAACLPGRTLHTALYLWRRSLTSSRSSFWLRIQDLDQLGLDRSAVYRSLKRLDDAGLIKVRRRSGSPPFVTILDCIDADTNDEGGCS